MKTPADFVVNAPIVENNEVIVPVVSAEVFAARLDGMKRLIAAIYA